MKRNQKELREKVPSSVYRLQFNASFTLKQAIELLPYFKEFGIEGIYTSPFYDSKSEHGYDVTNPNAINSQIGTPAEFDLFCSQLKKMGMRLIIDVVPNHMGIKAGQNAWWQDVLENGPFSEFASFFDIDWSPEKKELQDKVLLPILGEIYGNVLDNQQIRLGFKDGVFTFYYFDFPLPVAPETYVQILEPGYEELKGHAYYKDYKQIIDLYSQFPVSLMERRIKKEEGQKRLGLLVKKFPEIRQFIQSRVALLNGKKRQRESFDLLDKLLNGQFYRLAYWKVASHEINYRRFFNIHELVAICIEKQIVFDAHHRWILDLIAKRKVQGLRIDHPDGLFDPVQYFVRLREKGCHYTVVEKILDRKEDLPKNWEIDGDVGYQYLNILNGVFIRQEAEKIFTETYEEFIGEQLDYEEIVYESKKLFIHYHMVSEVESLAYRLDRISEKSRYYRDFTRFDLNKALQEMIASFPVYRTYIGPKGRVGDRDAKYIQIAIEKAKKRAPDLDISIFDFLEKLFLLKLKVRKEEIDSYREFILRFQQLTGPIMAKGLEDTCFYVYNRFISLNEVGGDPPHFGYSIGDFHRYNQTHQKDFPYGFLASSTHDTKRNEDVRMRLNVLSEVSEEWRLQLKKWTMLNARYKQNQTPTLNTEYFIYQTLVGAWPRFHLYASEWGTFVDRIWEVLLKSMREAKRETNWITPNTTYEDGVKTFLYEILSDSKDNKFLHHFLPFQKMIDRFGAWNSLSMAALKIGSAGVVDVYQGNEILNFALVDPDNRRTIDFPKRVSLLKDIKKKKPKFKAVDEFGLVKLYIQSKALEFRKNNRELFLKGEYLPLKVTGEKKEHVIAFARRYNKQLVIVCVGRFFASLLYRNTKLFPLGHVWENTSILLPKELKGIELEDLFTQKRLICQGIGSHAFLPVESIFEHYPVSYLYNESIT